MEAFAGRWTIDPMGNPGAIEGDKEAFKAMRPPNAPDMPQGQHVAEFTVNGNTCHAKLSVGGNVMKEEEFTIGQTREKTAPDGTKVTITSEFDSASGKMTARISGHKDVQIVRWVAGGQMHMQITCEGKTCIAHFDRA